MLTLNYNNIITINYKKTQIIHHTNLPITHQKHLIQIPYHQITNTIKQNTNIITIFTLNKTQKISTTTIKTKQIQSILLKIYNNNNFLYPNQKNNFTLKILPKIITKIQNLPELHLTKLTHFPYLL